jgi:hypothetical protein
MLAYLYISVHCKSSDAEGAVVDHQVVLVPNKIKICEWHETTVQYWHNMYDKPQRLLAYLQDGICGEVEVFTKFGRKRKER